jgi:hypothetical protein
MNRQFCSRCGNENAPDLNFCLQCGQSLKNAGSSQGALDELPPTIFIEQKNTASKGFMNSEPTVFFELPPTMALPINQPAIFQQQFGQSPNKRNEWLAKIALILSISSVVLFVLVNTFVIGDLLSLIGLGILFKLFLWGGILIWLGGTATGVGAAVLRFSSPQSYGGRGKAISSVILSAVGLLLIIFWFARYRLFN